MTRKLKDNSGQSTLEFALVLILLMSFTLFFVRLSLLMGFSNYVQYATFISARAYQAASDTKEDQETRATDMILTTVKIQGTGADRYRWIAQGEGGKNVAGMELNHPQFVLGDTNLSWLQGVRYTFRSKLFMLPFGGITSSADALNKITLTSESFLGREPSHEECVGDLEKKKGLYDNGC